MREYLNLITESGDALDAALDVVGDYIVHNAGGDLHSASATLHAAGYNEPFTSGSYFRALFHEITAEDREGHMTLGELYGTIQQHVRMDLNHPSQGFTTSAEKAYSFAGETLHYHTGQGKEHTSATLLSDVQSIVVVYEVHAPASAILMSMRGLKAFVANVPPGPGRDKLHNALNDDWDGYERDDEVMIDTRSGVRIAGVHMYESDWFE